VGRVYNGTPSFRESRFLDSRRGLPDRSLKWRTSLNFNELSFNDATMIGVPLKYARPVNPVEYSPETSLFLHFAVNAKSPFEYAYLQIRAELLEFSWTYITRKDWQRPCSTLVKYRGGTTSQT